MCIGNRTDFCEVLLQELLALRRVCDLVGQLPGDVLNAVVYVLLSPLRQPIE